MTNETISLHGTKELLQQARKDLVAAGFKDDEIWNDLFTTNLEMYLHLDKDGIAFYNHTCGADTVIDLTQQNYTHVINLIKEKLCKK